MNLNETNYHYFDAEKFAKMKKKPIVINLGRGLCMDEPALIEALDSGQIRAFAPTFCMTRHPTWQTTHSSAVTTSSSRPTPRSIRHRRCAI